MAELSAVPFSALPSTDDGYTLLNDNGIVHKSSKKLSELVGDDITGKLDKSQYAVDSATFLTAHQDISNKLDTTAFSTVSGDFLTEHQPISANEWNNVYETVVANSGTWGTESDWEPDIISASNNAYNSAVEWVKNQNYLTEHQDISNKLDTSSFSEVSGSFLTAHQDISNKMDKSESANFYPMTGNPSGFLTKQSLDEYATINYVDTEIGKIGSFEVVDLNEEKEPDVNEPSTKIIYLTKEIDSEKSDPYTEWIYNDTTSAWECIGETTLDLVNYYQKNETSAADEISAALDLKEDKIFVAVYNNNEKTSFADIKAAYDDGKKIYLKLDNFNENNPGVGWSPYEYIVPLNNFYTSPGGSAPTGVDYYIPTYWFQFDFLNDGNPHKLIIVKINDNDSWSTQVMPLNPDLTDYYTKSETCAASAISDALYLKEDKLTFAGKNNTITAINNSAIGGGGGESTTYNNGYLINIDSNNNINIRNNNCKANTANYAYAFGTNTTATGFQSFAIGYSTKANGNCAFAEGSATTADGNCAHSEGQFTKANSFCSHAEGEGTSALGIISHTEGIKTYTETNSSGSHAEGNMTSAIGNSSHTEGFMTYAKGSCSHSEGDRTSAIGYGSHAEGQQTFASADFSHSEGQQTSAGFCSHAEGSYSKAYNWSHSEGNSTLASGNYSHSEGYNTSAIDSYAHSEGNNTLAKRYCSHAEGDGTSAMEQYSHTEGHNTVAHGDHSHAEGDGTTAYYPYSHTEGNMTIASAYWSHTEGSQTYSFGDCSHAEGSSTSSFGVGSHTEGLGTLAYDDYMHVCGQYNATDRSALFVIGNGTSTNHSDAMIVSANGVVSAYDYYNAAGDKLSDLTEIISLLRNKPTTGTHVIKCIDGVLTWVTEQ